MVNFILTAIALGASLSAVAIADNCVDGIYYCGYNLLKKGNYFQDIYNSLSNAGQPHDDAHTNQSLFFCKGNDDVPFTAFCGAGCHDGGKGKSDSCN
ncbi:hypothetical protein F5B20DRAFT_581993 [Whalleya microplaca]|nr:hypothetical protein F5B20DRAFT_581993 [Whalleya microplaca]